MFFHHLHISYMPEDSDQHGAGGKLGTHVSVVVIMLNMHHCLLKSHVYMSRDWVIWGVRCGYVQQSYQTTPTKRVFFGFLCTRCPVLHFFLLPLGNGSGRRNGLVCFIFERTRKSWKNFSSFLAFRLSKGNGTWSHWQHEPQSILHVNSNWWEIIDFSALWVKTRCIFQ